MSHLTRLEALHRSTDAIITREQYAALDDPAMRRLRAAHADLDFWRDYVAACLTGLRNARRAEIEADLASAWPTYCRAVALVRQAERQIAEPTAAAAE